MTLDILIFAMIIAWIGVILCYLAVIAAKLPSHD